jgi:hypothetical protein
MLNLPVPNWGAIDSIKPMDMVIMRTRPKWEEADAAILCKFMFSFLILFGLFES